MYGKQFIVTLMLGLMFCLGATVEATEKSAAANTEAADPSQPAVSATPTANQKVAPPTVPETQAKNAADTAPEAFVPQKHHTFPSTMDGAKVLHDFIIQNKGDAPLKITKVRTG